jgi:hypothetical protein
LAEASSSPRIAKKLGYFPKWAEVPLAAARYLLPDENAATFVRQHPAIMAPSAAAAVGVFAAATFATVTSGRDRALVVVVWLVFLFMAARFWFVVFNWLSQYIVITERTFVLIAGITTRTVTALPMTSLSGMTLERSSRGRLIGFGAFRLGSDGPGQLIIDYVPYPEQLYLEIRNIIRAAEDNAAGG